MRSNYEDRDGRDKGSNKKWPGLPRHIPIKIFIIYIYNEQVLGNVPEHRLYFFFHFQIYINIVSQIRLVNP